MTPFNQRLFDAKRNEKKTLLPPFKQVVIENKKRRICLYKFLQFQVDARFCPNETAASLIVPKVSLLKESSEYSSDPLIYSIESGTSFPTSVGNFKKLFEAVNISSVDARGNEARLLCCRPFFDATVIGLQRRI